MSNLQRWVLLSGVIIATLVGATMIVSAHGGDPTKVHSCVLATAPPRAGLSDSVVTALPKGSVRIVDPNEACAANEVAVDWSLTGTGLQGPPGPAGPPGPQGPQGPAGASGGFSLIGSAARCTGIVGIFGGGDLCLDQTFEPQHGQVMPASGTLSNLTVLTALSCCPTSFVGVTLMKNGVATGLVCGVGAASPTTPPPGNAESYCVNDVVSVPVAKGDVVTLFINQSSVGTVNWAMKFTPQ